MKRRKIPMRKDIVTGEMAPKKELIRVVRDKEGNVSIDETGKKSGRGAYVSINVDVAKKAKQNKTFNEVFSVDLDDSFYDELIKYVDHKQARKELFKNGK
ncbi:RNase P modulator RnpM [Apilactobacillus timberlakei]|uniref:YlxR family protein n=1 Tax=Apilactobacillus timberlakei TaxID=2008380 RepID=A0ABY2YT37_9LACO|nr:YlxR family protein [Apilactobacillus timberlakei]TPR13833.1 YlxR family protein [Apilactobacillus timberlakei]TPR15148.1 YlxR family protein [Apilactobacillus timberlakei]TPR17040.1 YlxR family protein [Apilactobacillus timberlakei]TPR17442.1 YlxR family protein [Apilactobacillus timberlakei]TPR20033.1 YlxR family protein [Apilactobacillus timberlakei]